MSKSVGNVVDPRIVMLGGKDAKKEPPYGADVLRLWVASVDYSSDVMIGPRILGQVRGWAGGMMVGGGGRSVAIDGYRMLMPLSMVGVLCWSCRWLPYTCGAVCQYAAILRRWPTCTASCASRCGSCWATSQTLTPRSTPCRTTRCGYQLGGAMALAYHY